MTEAAGTNDNPILIGRRAMGDVRVLVVEDDDAIGEPLVAGLRREGFDVTLVRTAARRCMTATSQLW